MFGLICLFCLLLCPSLLSLDVFSVSLCLCPYASLLLPILFSSLPPSICLYVHLFVSLYIPSWWPRLRMAFVGFCESTSHGPIFVRCSAISSPMKETQRHQSLLFFSSSHSPPLYSLSLSRDVSLSFGLSLYNAIVRFVPLCVRFSSHTCRDILVLQHAILPDRTQEKMVSRAKGEHKNFLILSFFVLTARIQVD